MKTDDRFDKLERFAPLFEAPGSSFEGFLRRRDRRRRNQRIAAGVVAIAIFVIPIALILATGGWPGRTAVPADTAPTVAPRIASSLFFLDLRTGETAPLADSFDVGQSYNFAASYDGTRLAYAKIDDQGNPQIFVARIDGTEVHQVTHDPTGARSPAWSPDGTRIAYVGHGGGDVQNLFVLEIATGETTQITDGFRDPQGPSFTPDGSSLIYTDPVSSDGAEMRTVPIAGGQSSILFGGGHGGMGHAGGGSMSPDGSLVTMTGNEVGGPGAALFVSNLDGTQRRTFPAYGTTPAGTWSPDGNHLVGRSYGGRIIVIDVATGDVSRLAEGDAAIWIDDHTLLVDA